MTRFYLGILALSFPVSLAAQADSARALIEGKIVDLSGAPVAETEIVWLKDRRSVMSRNDGSFSLTIPVKGEALILIRRPGFNAQVLRVDLSSGSWRGEILLRRGTFQLPDLEVAAKFAKPAQYAGTTKFDDFFRRQKLGLGTFISREQIERMNAIHTLETLRNIPGVYVNVGIPTDPATADIRMPRCESFDHRGVGKVTVWIDGQRQIPEGGANEGEHGPGSYALAEMLSRISASGIEMIEVYRGPGQIPGEFHWDGCAAIVIWTRYNPAGVGQKSTPKP